MSTPEANFPKPEGQPLSGRLSLQDAYAVLQNTTVIDPSLFTSSKALYDLQNTSAFYSMQEYLIFAHPNAHIEEDFLAKSYKLIAERQDKGRVYKIVVSYPQKDSSVSDEQHIRLHTPSGFGITSRKGKTEIPDFLFFYEIRETGNVIILIDANKHLHLNFQDEAASTAQDVIQVAHGVKKSARLLLDWYTKKDTDALLPPNGRRGRKKGK